MLSIHRPSELSAAERLQEIATILGAGILRLEDRQLCVFAGDVENLSESPQTCLEVPSKAVLSVLTAVNGNRDPETRSTR